MSVGRSSRTPAKHWLLNAILGKISGVAVLDSYKVPCKVSNSQPMIMVDLCGGDGLSNETHDASPKIMYKHCEWLASKGKASSLTVIEKMENTFEQLQENCSHFDGAICQLINGDATEYRLPSLKETQIAFIHCDPNTVHQTPLSSPFVAGFNRYTTYLVTLGCNPGSLKRLKLEERSEWFNYIKILIDVLPSRHDAVLFWLNRDDAQWAYLLSIPKVWSEEFTSYAVKKTSELWPKGVSAVSYRGNKAAFADQIAKLFLTKDEYDEL